MSDLEKKLDLHIEEDRHNFNRQTDILDRIETKIDLVRGQWKVVGVVIGALFTMLGTVLSAWLF